MGDIAWARQFTVCLIRAWAPAQPFFLSSFLFDDLGKAPSEPLKGISIRRLEEAVSDHGGVEAGRKPA